MAFNNDTKVRGDSDNTLIGNSGDRLKVDASITAVSSNPGSYSSKLRYLDMNASNGGIARAASVTDADWVDLFSYSGSGLLVGFGINLETGTDWRIRLVVDGEDIFNDATNGLLLNDVAKDSLYDWNHSGKSTAELAENIGIFLGVHDRFVWNSPLRVPTRYGSSVVVKVRRVTGASSRKFQAGLMVLTKDT